MRAKTVNENIGFQRGQSPKNAVGVGILQKYKDDLISAIPYYNETGLPVKEQLAQVSGLSYDELYIIVDWWRNVGDGAPDDDINNVKELIGETKPYYDDYGPSNQRYLVYATDYGKFIAIRNESESGDTEEWFGDIEAKIASEQ